MNNNVGSTQTSTPRTLTVQQAPTITSANSATFAVGTPGSFNVTATGTGTISYTVISGSFPPWATLGLNTGIISGTPSNTTGSPFTFTIQADNGVAPAATQSFTLTVNTVVAPSISVQPTSALTVNAGNTANFSVTASGTPTPTYQWQISTDGGSNYTNLANSTLNIGGNTVGTVTGATTNALAISGVTTGLNASKYRVLVTNNVNGGTTVTSSVSTLTVNSIPVITNSTTTYSASAGQTANGATIFAITTSGTPAPTSYAISSGALPVWATLNTSTGVITANRATTTGDVGATSFSVTATNSVGTSAAVGFTTTVTTGPTIVSQPANISILPGNAAQFTVSATASSGSLTFQWYRAQAGTGSFSQPLPDNSIYFVSPSTNSSTLTLNAASTSLAMNGDQFRVVVTDSLGQTTSTAATLTILQAPAFTSLTTATFTALQAGTTFQVQATGSPAPTISVVAGGLPSWSSISVSSSGTTTTGLITGTPPDTAGSPFAVTFAATNSVTTATQNFTLTVLPVASAPAFTTQPANQSVNLGQPATFTVVVTGSPTPTLQWQRQTSGTNGFFNITDGGVYSGTTTASLLISSATTGLNGDQYQCIATNANGIALSTAGTLSVSVGTIVSTLAGEGTISGVSDGTGSGAHFNNPQGIATDGQGNFYIADTVNCVIRRVTSSGVVTTVAGLAGVAGNTDGPAASARFNGPSGIALDSSGNIYVADTFSHTIRIITNGSVATLAGQPGAFGSADGTGNAARFTYPTGLAMGPGGALYVADSFNHTIRSVTTGGVVTTYAGQAGNRGSSNGTSNFGGTTGTARFNNPNGVAVDTAGNVYVADSFNYTIRKIDQFGSVTTLAGQPGIIGSTDATGTLALFNQPNALTVDGLGNIYVADTFNMTIRKITSAGVVTTIAGLTATTGTTDGFGNAARFNQPGGIVVDSSGNLFVSDTKNHTIRRSGTVSAPIITSQPIGRTAGIGQTVTFTVGVTGSPTPNFQWQRQAAGTSGFVNVINDSTYSGATTATLTVSGATTTMNGDQFQCFITNFVSPDALTAVAGLTVAGVAPVFTSATSTTFTAGQSGSFAVAATGTPTPTFSATGLPSWASLDTGTGIISGTPPDTSGSPFTIALAASNGLSTTQTFTLTVNPAITIPVISNQPTGFTVDRGQFVTFSVSASGTGPLSYQWSKDGVAIGGATDASYTVTNIQVASAGSYSVRITNSAGSVTSSAAVLAVNSAPVISAQPRAQTVLAGNTATLSVTASGSPAVNYQWRLNGSAIAGATNSSLSLFNVQAGSSGNYDVLIGNQFGTVTSSLAQLSVVSTSTTPAITASPASTTVLAGGLVSLSVAATGVPVPVYQWRKNGSAILGATNANYVFNFAQPGDAGNYDVVVTNNVGSTVSLPASVKIISRSYAGIYFGNFGSGQGSFAMLVRPDNTAAFVGFLSGAASTGVVNLDVAVTDAGTFSFLATSGAVSGSISNAGAISGSITGSASAALNGTKSPDTGNAQGRVGFYRAGVASGSGTAYIVASASSQVFVLTQSGATAFDGGVGALDGTGRAVISTSVGSITVTVSADGTSVSVSGTRNNQNTNYAGANEDIIATQRLANISTRARVDTGSNIAIAGFVISGQLAKPVLIRAIGPTLATFGVTTALGAPKLDLFRGSTVIATNTGWASAGNSAAIAAATTQAGGFALAPTSADSVIFTTLPPGNYTAQVSAASGAAGVALIEVYDLSAPSAGQKLFNISTRATAGAGDATLIAGISVSGSVPKRVLIRAIGPGLAQFGLTGLLATPQLQIVKDGTVVASNAGINTSPDAAAITTISAQVGAFALPANSADCALLVNLAPGNYSALVSGAGTATGIAIVEVYEVP